MVLMFVLVRQVRLRARLTEAEQTQYTLALALLCAVAVAGTLAASWWPAAIVLGAVAARKLQIYIKRVRRGL
jgi:hypothetical protein